MKALRTILLPAILAAACASPRDAQEKVHIQSFPGVTGHTTSRAIVSADGKEKDEVKISYQFYTAPKAPWQDSVNCKVWNFVSDCLSFERQAEDCPVMDKSVFEAKLDTFVSYSRKEQDIEARSSILWGFESESVIIKALKGYAQIDQSCYIYTGGAHPNTIYVCSVISHAQATPMRLADFIGDIPAFNWIAEHYFRAEKGIPENQDISSDQTFWFPNRIFECNDNFLIDKQGFHFVFNAYEIAPYVFGPTHFTVPMKDVKHLLIRELYFE